MALHRPPVPERMGLWVRAPAYDTLSGAVQIHEAASEDAARHAVEKAIASAANSRP